MRQRVAAVGQIVVHDLLHAADVEPSRSDVGRHDTLQLARAKVVQATRPLALRHLAAQRADGEAEARQLSGDVRGRNPRANEDQEALVRMQKQEVDQSVGTLMDGHDNHQVVDVLVRRAVAPSTIRAFRW